MRVTFANNYTSAGGRIYKGGSTHEVNDATARSLIVRGKARPADEPKSAPAAETKTNEGAE